MMGIPLSYTNCSVVILNTFSQCRSHRNLPAQLKRFLLSREPLRRRSSQFIVPLSELDFTGCPREGRSYLKLPETFRRLWCEGREYESQEILDQLNDDFVSIPQGSEEDAFRHVKRNPYEEVKWVIQEWIYIVREQLITS